MCPKSYMLCLATVFFILQCVPQIKIRVYRKISNIRRTKSPNLDVSRLVVQLSSPNLMKPGVKSRMKMQLEQRQLHLSDRQFYCLLRCVLYQRLDGMFRRNILSILTKHGRGNNIYVQLVFWFDMLDYHSLFWFCFCIICTFAVIVVWFCICLDPWLIKKLPLLLLTSVADEYGNKIECWVYEISDGWLKNRNVTSVLISNSMKNGSVSLFYGITFDKEYRLTTIIIQDEWLALNIFHLRSQHPNQ